MSWGSTTSPADLLDPSPNKRRRSRLTERGRRLAVALVCIGLMGVGLWVAPYVIHRLVVH